MLEIIYYIVIGISTGLLSGLLGVGGGIMTVPALALMMQQHPAFHLAHTMHIAASTSLVAMTMTSASTAYAYYRRKALVFQIFWKMLPGLCCGLVSGSVLSHAMSNTLLITLFAFFLIGVAIHLLFDAKRTMPRSADKYQFSKQRFSAHEHWILIIGSFMVGNLSTTFGIGGGILMVPLFLLLHCSMQESAGTSALCGIVCAVIGTLLLSYPMPTYKLPYTWSNVYWPAALLIGTTSVACAPFGTRLAFYLKSSMLKQIFSGLLLCSALILLRNSMSA